MKYLFLAIISSVFVSAILKIMNFKNIDARKAVAFNYISASLLCALFFKPDFNSINLSFSIIFLILGILLPSGFIIMAKAVKYAGIVRADAAQRLSLFLAIIAAFTIFSEKLNAFKVLGVILAFISLFCLVYKSSDTKTGFKGGFYLFSVWLVYGFCDILFKEISKLGGEFSSTLLISFLMAGLIMFAYLFSKNTKFDIKSSSYGIMLGIFNFCNIIFYIKAHQSFSQNPSLVFIAMNIGVIIFSVFVGILAFKEKISKINAAGILFGILAIAVLFLV